MIADAIGFLRMEEKSPARWAIPNIYTSLRAHPSSQSREEFHEKFSDCAGLDERCGLRTAGHEGTTKIASGESGVPARASGAASGQYHLESRNSGIDLGGFELGLTRYERAAAGIPLNIFHEY